MTQLDGLSPLLRTALLAGTAILLGGTTLGLGRTPWSPWQVDVVVALTAALVLATWWALLSGVRAAAPPDHPERLRAMAVAGWVAPRLGWADRLAAVDLGFSVPVLFRAIRALAGPGRWGAPAVESVAVDGEVVLTAVVPGSPEDGSPLPAGAAGVRLRLTRPLGVPFPRPGSDAPRVVAGPEPGAVVPTLDGWRLTAREALPTWAPPPPVEDVGMPAARRALLARDPAFDPSEIDSYVRMIRSALASDPAVVEPAARGDLAFLGGAPDQPIDQVRWLEVEVDGWSERLEVVCGGLWLSLWRPSGRPDAAWTVWRVQAAGRA